jgi:hypothetical protein
MKLRKLRILGCDFEIGRNINPLIASGTCTVGPQRIEIAPGARPQQERSTLLHEVLEAVNRMLEIGLEHPQIVALEASLNAVLADNPEFVRLWSHP